MQKIVSSSVLALGALFGSVQSNVFGIVSHNPLWGATDAEHIALAAQPEFQASGWFSYTNSSTGETAVTSATLVSPEWVVTSQHNTLASTGTTSLPLSGMKVGFGSNALTDSTKYSVTQVIRVPGFSTANFANDLAFLKLATPVTDVAPVPLYTGTLLPLQQVTTIGHGQPGTPSGLLPFDGIERGMVNRISPWDPHFYLPDAVNMVMTQFVPDNEYGDFEYLGGTVAPGDDGGGLMVLDNGVWKLAGVTSFNLEGPPGYYANSFYTEMSAYIPWIGNQAALASLVPVAVPEPTVFASLLLTGALVALKRKPRQSAR